MYAFVGDGGGGGLHLIRDPDTSKWCSYIVSVQYPRLYYLEMCLLVCINSDPVYTRLLSTVHIVIDMTHMVRQTHRPIIKFITSTTQKKLRWMWTRMEVLYRMPYTCVFIVMTIPTSLPFLL